MKKILITGSCGFLMGNLLRKMIYEKFQYQFVSIDRVSSSNKNSLYWNKGHVFHIGDIRDKHIVETIFQFERPDIVIHGAEEKTNEDDLISTNVHGTKVVVDACRKFDVERLVHISTSDTEDNFYNTSKYSSELFVKSSKLNHNILKISDSYGPRQSSNELIPAMINKILNNESVTINDDSKKEYTHVHDISMAIINVLLNGEIGKNYVVSSGEISTKREILKKVCTSLNRDYPEVQGENSTKEFILDSSEIKKIWKPQYTLNNLYSNTIDWYLKNKWFFR